MTTLSPSNAAATTAPREGSGVGASAGRVGGSAGDPGLSQPLIGGMFTRAGLVQTLVLLGAFVALYWRWFWVQHRSSAGAMEDWGHAYVIPLISGYMVWMNRAALAAVPKRAYWPGLAPLLLGIFCYIFFAVGSVRNHMFQGFSAILTLFGLVLLMLGPGAMRLLFLPIAFLAFGVTISERVMLEITFPLQLFASAGAWVLLSVLGLVFGYTAEVDANVITVFTSDGRPIPLDVAEACSGMRMVVAFIALSGAVAIISCRAWWQRLALLLLSIPVALFMNVIRVAVLGLGSMYIDPEIAAGDAHMFIGTLLLIPALGLFMAVRWALDRIVREDAPGAPLNVGGAKA